MRLCLWLGANYMVDLLIQKFNGTFEACEFHHCVWDLTHPKWYESFVECIDTLFLHHLWNSLTQCGREPGHRLDFNLGSFEWTESNISKEFSRSGCSQVQAGTVQVCILFANQISVVHFEQFVETEFEQTLWPREKDKNSKSYTIIIIIINEFAHDELRVVNCVRVL